MKSDLLERIKQWIIHNQEKEPLFYGDESEGAFLNQDLVNSVGELRYLLGELMKEVNEVSKIYKTSMRSPSQENIQAAKKIIDELENWSEILKHLQLIKNLFASSSKHFLRFANNSNHILSIIQYLEKAKFSQSQIETIRQITSGQNNLAGRDFPDEVNQEGMDKVFRNSIYNIQSGAEKTLKVLREVLQNAVDATHPQQKPELTLREGWLPEVHVETSIFKDHNTNEYLMDIIVEDKGVGMDWDIISKKFFVTFESGKNNDIGATGGFGIAKALIQDAPDHGWSIDTNNIHSSRFHKNVFLGTRKTNQYDPPKSEISNNGTKLSLYGLPYVMTEHIEKLCSVYATNGKVKIFLNGKEQTPSFLLDADDVKQISRENLNSLAQVASDDESEKEVADRVLEKKKSAISEKIQEVGLLSGERNKYSFYLKRSNNSGKLYVMLNGQYQFDEEKYMSRLDVIVSVETKARPGDNDYPLDPGREYLRGNAKNLVDEFVSLIKDFARELSNDELFKDGIESLIVNDQERPMMIDEEESTTQKKDIMMKSLQQVTGGAFEETEEEVQNQDAQKRHEFDQKTNEEKIELVVRNLSSKVDENSPFSKDAIKRMVSSAVESSEDRVEQNKKIKEIIEGLVTPGHILVQKNFVAKKAVSENPKMTGEMLIIWQKTVKLIIKKMTSVIESYNSARRRPFVPGLIYSDEALGLYMPSKSDRAFDSICINPITMSAYILPKLFREKLDDSREKDAFSILDQMEDSKDGSDTPTTRLAKFIFHVAVHEVCHFLYPDGYAPENFHKYITKIELICHDEYDQVRKIVKTHMPGLKKSARQLIGIVKKNKKKVSESFVRWLKNKNSILENNHIELLENNCFKTNYSINFKDFIKQQ